MWANFIGSTREIQRTRGFYTSSATIFLIGALILPAAMITGAPHNTEATRHLELCQRLGLECEAPTSALKQETSALTTSSSRKFFLAVFLQYVNRDAQINIYKPNLGSEDQIQLGVQGDDTLNSEYVTAAKNFSGPAGVAFKSSREVVEDAKRVKELGFNFIELNLEKGFSPDWDNNNVVAAFKRAAQAVHEQGLKFRAAPSKSYTTQFGPQIAPFVDYYHIQAQSLQDDGIKAYSDYVHSMIPKLERANSKLMISVQVSTEQGNAPGLSKLETLKKCISSVMDVADGASVWFSESNIQTLKSFVEWYNAKYDSTPLGTIGY